MGDGGAGATDAREHDVWSFNMVMAQGVKDGTMKFGDALVTLERMMGEGISPNAGTYGSIMDAAMLGGKEDRQTSLDALALLDAIPKEFRSTHVGVCPQTPHPAAVTHGSILDQNPLVSTRPRAIMS